MFSNNIAYPLTIAAEKPSVHVMHTGSNSQIILCHQQQVENNADFAYSIFSVILAFGSPISKIGQIAYRPSVQSQRLVRVDLWFFKYNFFIFNSQMSKNYGNCVLYHVDLFKPRIYSGKRTFVTALTAQVQPFLCLRRLIHAPLKYAVTFVFAQMRKYAKLRSNFILLYSFMYILHTTTLKCHIWMCECHFCLLLKRCENLRFYQFLVTF